MIATVDSGRLCVVFAEGRVTENGGLMKIYEAPGLLADKAKAPIIRFGSTARSTVIFQDQRQAAAPAAAENENYNRQAPQF